MHKCTNLLCDNETNNPKFCSRSCAVSYNNQKFPKRIKQKYFCRVCGIEIFSRRLFCDAHNPQKVDWSKRTIEEAVTYHNGASNRYGRIRDHAKRTYRNSDRPNKCEKCGYHKHYEVCHIKPIYLFSLNTIISVTNDINNLIALCPNCHWEFDNGLFAPTRNRT